MEIRCECGNLMEPGDEVCDECFAVNEYYQDRVLPLNFEQTHNREEEPEEAEIYAEWDWDLSDVS